MYDPALTGPPTLMWHPVWFKVDQTVCGGQLGIGIPAPPGGVGTNDISYEVQVVCSNSWSSRMEARIVQLCTLNGLMVPPGINSWCDNMDPFNGYALIKTNLISSTMTVNNLLPLEDAPWSPALRQNGTAKVVFKGNFTDFFMFNPGGPDDIDVPLANLSWGMNIDQTYPNTNLNNNTVTPPSQPTKSNKWPTYTHTYHNGD